MIFSIAMGADYLFYVKSIATYAPVFFGYNNSVLASVHKYISTKAMYFGYGGRLNEIIGFCEYIIRRALFS